MEDTIERAIGQEIRRRREAAGVGQSVIAMYARQFGVPWTRATVAAVELGRKQLPLGELTMMPLILREAGVTNGRLLLGDLIPEADRMVDLWSGGRLPLRDARALLLGGDDDQAIRDRLERRSDTLRALQALDSAEQKAALVLRVPPRAIVDAAYGRWGHSLSLERLERLKRLSGKRALTGAESPRRLQAILGHITRELLDELRPLLKAATKKKRRRAR